MSFLLQCGYDDVLLTTRELILRREGLRVVNVIGPVEAVRALACEKVDLLLLCHTLSEQELQRVTAAARALPQPPKVLTLLAYASPPSAFNPENNIFSTFDDPGSFLAVVHGLLDNHGAVPQPHKPCQGATPCRDSRAS